jgi:selenocysteine-specific elongation factor
MLAGTGCIDAVLLVISAEEGIKPQTEEHLAICNLLGVRRGLTAITKVDAVSPARLEAVHSEIQAFLRGTFLDGNILPVSAHSGEGLKELRQELLSLATQPVAGYADRLPRLPIDRAFVMTGFGTVVTRTLLSGSIGVGDTLMLEPSSSAVRVRGLQTHGRPEQSVHSGSRVALNLAGINVSEVTRGQTLVAPGTLTAVSIVDVETALLPGVRSLKHRAQVHFHAFTADTLATVSLYDYRPVEAGTRRLMRLRLHSPQVLAPGDRFVLRQCSPACTIGGGVVIDAHPLPNVNDHRLTAGGFRLRREAGLIGHAADSAALGALHNRPSQIALTDGHDRSKRKIQELPPAKAVGFTDPREATLKKSKCLAWLEAMNDTPLAQQLLLRIVRHGVAGLTLRALIAETGLAQDALLRLTGPIISEGQLIHIPGDLLVTSEALGAAIENIASRLKTDAIQVGVRRAELKNQTGLCKELLDFAIEKLAREQKLRLNGEFVCAFDSDAQATARDRTALARVAGAYQVAGLAAPQAADVAAELNLSDAEMRRLMTLLLRERTLLRIGTDSLYIHQSALAQLQARMSELRGQLLDVAGFK